MKEQVHFERTREEEGFCEDRDVHLINDQKQPGLGIHLDLSREAGHSKGIFRKTVSGLVISSISGSSL